MTGAVNLHKSEIGGQTCEQPFSYFAQAFGIDGINLPVLLVDGDARVLASNAKASKLLSRKLSDINGCLLGEVIGCVHSKGLCDCGETFHCASCPMRLIVTYTMVTGEECRKVLVYPDIDQTRRDESTLFMISTKKVFNYVFLTIKAA